MYLSQATTYETVTKSDGAKHVREDQYVGELLSSSE
ncbi:hypothetical protein Natpe_4076 (plasmid) [Natrinema pellirubrum DSM 15624]|uniref:Uncharacterized protein n=1 Tax=Natrinema pellirubrum (strain DSM 15624 / CIP 106293 / JCM 10476 / NCIMB 786 / 157) TaxID=797303 RepID=L0JSN0_NATP1|nr:hypothetical protein Natpe_4076 [Natrinema pellirubrum DSM 15624]